MVNQLYGFRPLPKPQYYKTDDVVSTPDARVPELAVPKAKQELASSSATRLNDYSGTSAENDSYNGPGQRLDGSVPEVSAPASYASPTEAMQYGLAGWNNGYYGTVQDAAASAKSNAAARGTLQDFIAAGPTGRKSAPGTLGFIGTKISNAINGGPQYDFKNIEDSLGALSETQALYNNDNSSGYFGDTVQEQQTVSDVDATSTYGTGFDQMEAPEVIHSYAGLGLAPEVEQSYVEQNQQANYDHYQDNSSDDNHGQTDGTQTGGETSHAGGYGGYADDTAATNSDSGGGGGGGK